MSDVNGLPDPLSGRRVAREQAKAQRDAERRTLEGRRIAGELYDLREQRKAVADRVERTLTKASADMAKINKQMRKLADEAEALTGSRPDVSPDERTWPTTTPFCQHDEDGRCQTAHHVHTEHTDAFAIQFAASDLKKITEAARQAGMSPARYVQRAAALAAYAGEHPLEPAQRAAQDLLRRAQELVAMLGRVS